MDREKRMKEIQEEVFELELEWIDMEGTSYQKDIDAMITKLEKEYHKLKEGK